MKVKFAYKAIAFIASVITLSWFFAGWRLIHESADLTGWLYLVGGTVATLLLLGLQGYWIYFEEKAKGTLRKRIDLFERIHAYLQNCRCTGGSGSATTGPDKRSA